MLDSQGSVRVAAPDRSAVGAGEGVELPAGGLPDARETDLRDAIAPMLDAVVHFVGAAAGAIRLSRPGRPGLAPVVVVGPGPRGAAGDGVLARWCGQCAESADPTSACVRTDLCGHDERLPARRLESVCRHILVVPLHHAGQPVGMLDLVFDAPCELPAGMPAMLQAAGDLIGISLEKARLADEVMRVTLMNERQMMASEVHDSIAQGLTYMRMRMSLLSDAIRQRDELRAFKYWSDVDDSLTHAHARVRELITCFRSRMDPQGLVHALTDMAERFADRTGVELSFANRVTDFRLAPAREVEVFHIVQEALANVVRHAKARHARMTLDRTAEGYEIVVADDGTGLPDDAASGERAGHYGVEIMRERAARLGGAVSVGPADGGGTQVRLTFPERRTGRDESSSTGGPSRDARPLFQQGGRAAAASAGPSQGSEPPSGGRERRSPRGTPTAASLGEGCE
ncbi:MAG: ATP-binding protein [Burkholderiales bacterium]|nr:ATP-binding protein [Burkholderiales bacterium]